MRPSIGSDVGIRLAMSQPDIRQAEPDRRGIGQEQVRPIPDLRSDAVLQQSVRDVDGGAEKIAS